MSKMWAGYRRVSRVGDREDTLMSPDLQADRISTYALARGLEVDMLAPELDVSGGAVERPLLGRILEAIETGGYAGVIVAQLDRLSRMDIFDAVKTVRRIEEAGGQVISVAENFDATTPEGRMARNVMFAVADMQLGRYKAQFLAAKQRAVANGVWIGKAPVGYLRGEDRRLVPDPKRGPVVVRAFRARATGSSASEVADILGTGISHAKRILSSRVYLGEVNYAGIASNAQAHPPLVDRAVWEAAQTSLPRPARNASGLPRALLTGLVRCAGCQRLMSPNTDSKGGRFYRCVPRNALGRCQAPATIMCRVIDPYVDAAALAILDEHVVASRASDRTTALDHGLRELAAAEAELGAWIEHVRISDVGAGAYRQGIAARQTAVENARRVVARAQLAAGPVPGAMDLRDAYPGLAHDQRAHVLRGLLGVVWVRRGRLPVTERVRVVAAGHEPPDLPRPGPKAYPIDPFAWPNGDLPGEVRPIGA